MVGTVLAQMMDGEASGGMGDGWWWIWAVAGVVVIALLVVLVLEVSRRGTRDFDSPPVHPSSPGAGATGAEQVLAERFARGEIDADEYRSRRDVLRS